MYTGNFLFQCNYFSPPQPTVNRCFDKPCLESASGLPAKRPSTEVFDDQLRKHTRSSNGCLADTRCKAQ